MKGVAPRFDHIAALTDRYGTFEHADHATRRREHGYCTDDVARLLVVTSREPSPTSLVRQLARGALRFVVEAQQPSGTCRNRRASDGTWQDDAGVDDCWGRSLWGLGTAVEHAGWWLDGDPLPAFDRGAQQRSAWPRSMAFAALGAAAVANAHPGHRPALDLLADAADLLEPAAGDTATSTGWAWPEPRLSYANAALPDALVAAGTALDRPALVVTGLELLAWLLERETYEDHLSVTPVGGAGPDDPPGPRFDQQAIEVATMAEACARAAAVTGDAVWVDAVRRAAGWFDGDNDSDAVMWNRATGGGYDGLQSDGPNLNQGAESTLALISTRQQHRALGYRG